MGKLNKKKFLKKFAKAEEYKISEEEAKKKKCSNTFRRMLKAETMKDINRLSMKDLLDAMENFDVFLGGNSKAETLKQEIVETVKESNSTLQPRIL